MYCKYVLEHSVYYAGRTDLLRFPTVFHSNFNNNSPAQNYVSSLSVIYS